MTSSMYGCIIVVAAEAQALRPARLRNLTCSRSGFKEGGEGTSTTGRRRSRRGEVSGLSYANKPIIEDYRDLTGNLRPSSHGQTGGGRMHLKLHHIRDNFFPLFLMDAATFYGCML